MKRKYIVQTLTRQIMLVLILVMFAIVLVLVNLEYNSLVKNIKKENENFSNNVITQIEVVVSSINNTAQVVSTDI